MTRGGPTWLGLKEQACVVCGLVLALWLAGCAAHHRPPLLFAGEAHPLRAVQRPSDPPISWLIRAEGSVVSSPRGPAISLKISNHTSTPIHLSSITDHYSARLSDGRTVEIEEDFLRYPSKVGAGGEEWVALLLPKDVPASAIVEILGKIDEGRLLLTVMPVRQGQMAGYPDAPSPAPPRR